ncbi:hypothetical protein [Candidatus Odyssella acanthamoebae]|uniref:Uncharacterized protein n=1 Tax=Candidatus Odyssella acanthamoebae TaxID=91604 RepID=A0A077ATC7_9PROT|nr:hypothetical protein [Candidatus Paracaedibacter acanthamoebae]AIK95646.1 hypothetical protein ID47_01170 [Candidatus Paracaedibacter acanthamoebae]
MVDYKLKENLKPKMLNFFHIDIIFLPLQSAIVKLFLFTVFMLAAGSSEATSNDQVTSNEKVCSDLKRNFDAAFLENGEAKVESLAFAPVSSFSHLTRNFSPIEFQSETDYQTKLVEDEQNLKDVNKKSSTSIIRRSIWKKTREVDISLPVGLRVHKFTQIMFRDSVLQKNLPINSDDTTLSNVLRVLQNIACKIQNPLEDERDYVFGNKPNILAVQLGLVLKDEGEEAHYFNGGYLWISSKEEPNPGNSVTVFVSGNREVICEGFMLSDLKGYYDQYKAYYSLWDWPDIQLYPVKGHTEEGLIRKIKRLQLKKKDIIKDKIFQGIKKFRELSCKSKEQKPPLKKQAFNLGDEDIEKNVATIILHMVSGREICIAENVQDSSDLDYETSCYYRLNHSFRSLLYPKIPSLIFFSYHNNMNYRSMVNVMPSAIKSFYYADLIDSLRIIVCRKLEWASKKSPLPNKVYLISPSLEIPPSLIRAQLIKKLRKHAHQAEISPWPILSQEEWKMIKKVNLKFIKEDVRDFKKKSPFLSYLLKLKEHRNIHASYLIARAYEAAAGAYYALYETDKEKWWAKRDANWYWKKADEIMEHIFHLDKWDSRNEGIREGVQCSLKIQVMPGSLGWYHIHTAKHLIRSNSANYLSGILCHFQERIKSQENNLIYIFKLFIKKAKEWGVSEEDILRFVSLDYLVDPSAC